MRLALLSDIHANLRALQACLAHARAQGATHFAVLGDLVGYGAEPAAVVEAAMALAADGATVLQGNHDELAVRGQAAALTGGALSYGEAGAAWTHEQLGSARRDYLAGLPLVATLGPLLLVHATADDPPAWHYADNAPRAARCLEAASTVHGRHCVFGGHVHEQRLWFDGRRGDPMPFTPTPGTPVALPRHRRWLATMGSVGQPRDGDPRAAYALWVDEGATPQLTFWRVPYDHIAAAEAVRRSGLPQEFARRLMEGR
jgi:predicted phosphodiesterase